MVGKGLAVPKIYNLERSCLARNNPRCVYCVFNKNLAWIMSYRLVGALTVVATAALLALAAGPADRLHVALVYLALSVAAGVGASLLLLGPLKRRTKIHVDARYAVLRKLAEIADDKFASWYLPVVAEASPHALRSVAAVLGRRREKILGVESGYEAARGNRERWTYAVFIVATVTYTAGRREADETVAWVFASVPESARDWLCRDAHIVQTMFDAIINKRQTNAIWQIVAPDSLPIGMKPEKPQLKQPETETSVAACEPDTREPASAARVVTARSAFETSGLLVNREATLNERKLRD